MIDTTKAKTFGRIFYGICFIGNGIIHFIFPSFRPIIMADPALRSEQWPLLVYMVGAILVLVGALISFGKKVQTVALYLGLALLILLLFFHLPYRISTSAGIFGYYTDAIKLLALSGGAFLIATEFRSEGNTKFESALLKFADVGKYLFAAMLIFFGIGHLTNTESVARIVPQWIPFPLFWTVSTGIALIGAGISILTNYKMKQITLLLALMLFLWLISLHLYYAIRFPNWQGNFAGSFECLAFCGIALILWNKAAQQKKVKLVSENL